MKKKFLITALILAVSAHCAMSEETINSPEDLEKMFTESFYESPISAPMPKVEVKEGSTIKPTRGMPLFKKTRIKITNYLREKDYKKNLELIEKEKQELAKQEAQEQEELNKELHINVKDSEKSNVDTEDKKDNSKGESKITPAENTLELEGGVKKHVTSNDVVLDADNIDYDEKTSDIIATGSPVLVFPPQNVTIKADKMIYNNVSNVLKAYGKVEVIRDGNSVFGDYMQINLNEENAFMDNIKTKASMMTVYANKSEMEGDKVILHNGKMVSEDHYLLDFHTKMIGGNHFNRMIIDDEDKSSITDEIGDTAINIKAKEISINAKRDHDVITLKKAHLYYGDTKLFSFPSITAHTNKERQFFDANYPEFGSRGRLGMFAGPGFVFDTPLQNGSTIKVIPIINNKSGIGFGGMLKYRSGTNYTDMAYGSSADVFILKGKQYLDDRLYFQYGANSYMDEWWFGPRMPKYTAELIYHDRGIIPSTIGDGLNLNFRHRFGIGYMQNNDVNRHGENIAASDIGTLRTRYMAEAAQTLFNYEDRENLRMLNLALVLQGSAALYGTGDTQFIGRIGPRVHTQYKYWMQDIGFFASAYQDGTPMQRYDMYRYGHANLYIREALRVHKYLTLAWSGTVTLTGDSPNGEMFQENSFIIAVGPDDFKINFGYDWVRRQTYFAFVVAMDTKGSSVDFEKMEIKNPDRLARSNQENVELKVFDVENTDALNKKPPKKMIYAEVIDIEDPDKEQI